jgi:hypothetical protein
VLDARTLDVDAPGLRAAARALTARAGIAHATRSYRFPYALVAWHSQPVGIDIEREEPFDAVFMDSICTPSERFHPRSLGNPDRFLASLWSSKEALAKGLGDAVHYDPRRLESPIRWPDGRAGGWRAEQLEIAPGHAAWLCWRAA